MKTVKKLFKYGNVVVQGYQWKDIFKKDFIIALMIQFFTLSSAVHTYLLFKHNNVLFKLEATWKKGILLNIVDENKYLNIINNQECNYYTREPYGYYHEYVLRQCEKLIYDRIKTPLLTSVKLGRYNIIGILNIPLYKIFGISFINKTDDKIMFCSQTNHFFNTSENDSFLKVPRFLIWDKFYK